MSNTSLRIGDIIVLKNVRLNAYLGGDGIIIEEVGVNSDLLCFQDGLFQVCSQLQYSAANEYDEFLDKVGEDINYLHDYSTQKHLEALVRGKSNEIKMNEKFMKLKYSYHVHFGDIVQLKHVKSGKFLTVKMNELARDERENLCVHFAAGGSQASWLQLMPRYKIDREGDKINMNTELLLKVSEKQLEFIHCSDKPPPPNKLREVNSSAESATPWKMSIYQSSTDALDTSKLLMGQLVYIKDPESQSYLFPLISNAKNISNSSTVEANIPASRIKEDGSDDDSGGKSDADDDEDAHSDVSLTSLEEFTQEHGQITLMPMDDDKMDTNAIWIVESKATTKGGPIRWRTEALHLRHFNSGMYLSMKHDDLYSDKVIFVLVPETADRNTIFHINELHAGSEYLSNSKAVQIRQGNTLLERMEYNDRHKLFVCSGTRIKTKAVSLLIRRYTEPVDTNDLGTKSLDVHICASTMFHLKRFRELIVVPSIDNFTQSTIWPSADAQDKTTFFNMIDKACNYLQGYPILIDSNMMHTYKIDVNVIKRRQNIYREKDLLTVIVDILDMLRPIASRILSGDAALYQYNEGGLLESGRSVVFQVLKLLQVVVKGNSANQMYVADYMMVILAHVSIDHNAAAISREIFGSNRELQETKIGVKEITLFADRMTESEMNPMFLKLLQSCLSSHGKGIIRNQNTVHDVLHSKYKNLTIKVSVVYDANNPIKVDWESSPTYSMYIPDDIDTLGYGKELLQHGLPSIFLTWKCTNTALAAQTLFETSKVKLGEVFKVHQALQNTLPNAKGAIQFSSTIMIEKKRSVADFFVAQLFLSAEMCLGRNYDVIKDLETMYSFDMLLAIIKMRSASDALKGAAARLISSLYVDRDPQVASMLPRLSRTWNGIASERTIATADKAVEQKFGLLQLVISDFVKNLRGKPFGLCSLYMIQVFENLLHFNFYRNDEMLHDCIDPLVALLYRKGIEYEDVLGIPDLQMIISAPVKLKKGMRRNSVSNLTRALSTSVNEKTLDAVEDQDNSIVDAGDGFFAPLYRRMGKLKLPGFAARIVDTFNSIVYHSNPLVTIKPWVLPNRYTKTCAVALKTIISIGSILSNIQRTVEDRNISLLLMSIYEWHSKGANDVTNCIESFKDVCAKATELRVSSDEYDNIYMDLLMYSSFAVNQVVLEILMAHHSSRLTLIQNISKLQLLVSDRRETQYKIIEKHVSALMHDVDTFGMWGKLQSVEHRKTNADTFQHLDDMIEMCRKQRLVLEFDEIYEPEKVIQDILRNIGCFDVCLKILQLFHGIDPNQSLTVVSKNTKKLVATCNELLYWFVLDNPMNQEIVYSHLHFFMKTIDPNNQIHSDKVIKGIFNNNDFLMKSLPKQYVADAVALICNSGRIPQYLALPGSVVTCGAKNMIDNQYEVIRSFSSPGNQKKVSLYFVPVTNPEYQKKLKLMANYANRPYVSIDELPSDLAYHLELMSVLSKCTVGQSGMSTIEAKVQSLFHFVDVCMAMLDPACLLIARIKLGLYLFNAVLDVEIRIPSVKDADCIWKLLESFVDIFNFAKDDVRQVEKLGLPNSLSIRQKLEYVLVAAYVTYGYFHFYFDQSVYRSEKVQTAVSVEPVSISQRKGNELIATLFTGLKSVYDMQSPVFSHDYQELFYNTLTALNTSSSTPIVSHIDDLHSIGKQSTKHHESEVQNKVNEFIQTLVSDDEIKQLTEEEVQDFIRKLNALPKKGDLVEADVRFEPLIAQIINHVRECVQIVVYGDETTKYIPANQTKTSIWVIKLFRTMIENKWGMSIDERDEDGGEEQDEASAELTGILNQNGATSVCLDLIARGIDIALQAEAIKLLVALLFKEGGALEVQKSINAHLSKPGSDLFFLHIRSLIGNLISWHKWTGVILLEEEQEPNLPKEIILIRLLQLMCEGHYLPNQEIMREQPNNVTQVNLLDDFTLFCNCLDTIKCRTSTTSALAVGATILEIIQGPCVGNQEHFALNTELIETLNRKLRHRPVNDCIEAEELELKKCSIDILQAMLEGQGVKTNVYDRMLSVIHLDVIQMLSEKPENGTDESEEAQVLRTDCLVFMQMLFDYKRSLRDELGVDNDPAKLGKMSIACVEVVWRGELQRRFFHIPDICGDLAKSTKDDFILCVDRSSFENKLYGLYSISKVIYRELLHQKLLKDLGVARLCSKTNLDTSSWVTFWLALLTNLMFITFYTTRWDDKYSHDDYLGMAHTIPYIPFGAKEAIHVLCVLNVVAAGETFLMYVIVRMPVIYTSHLDNDTGALMSLVYTVSDPMALYRILFLAFAIIGSFSQYNYFLSFLLLDIITKNATLQNVLMAAYYPRKQIIMTIVLTWIITYIFATFYFTQYNDPDIIDDFQNTNTLVKILKWFIRYASETGDISFVSQTILSMRYLLEVMFFMIMFIMWNVIKGITIDTFVELRSKMLERIHDTEEVCFICGIGKQVFTRVLDRDAFDNHVRYEQNLWNYIYFIIFIWEQDKDDDDGLEYYVRHLIDDTDLSWFPMNKAISLSEHQAAGGADSLTNVFSQDLSLLEAKIDEKVNVFKDSLARSMVRVEQSIALLVQSDSGVVKAPEKVKAKKIVVAPVTPVASTVVEVANVVPEVMCDSQLFVAVKLASVVLTFRGKSTEKYYCRVMSQFATYMVPSVSHHHDHLTSDYVLKFDPDALYQVHQGPLSKDSKFYVQLQIVSVAHMPHNRHEAVTKVCASVHIPLPKLVEVYDIPTQFEFDTYISVQRPTSLSSINIVPSAHKRLISSLK